MRAFAIVISGLLLATPVAAQSPSEGAERPTNPTSHDGGDQASDETNDGERRICRRVETNTGSRVPFRRMCLTERQWEAYRRQN
jgi:hypothetical protein